MLDVGHYGLWLNHPPSQTTCLWLGPPAIVITFAARPAIPNAHEAPLKSLPSWLEHAPGLPGSTPVGDTARYAHDPRAAHSFYTP